MSGARDPTLRELDGCGCCEGTGLDAPAAVWNRPGLSQISYRIGDQAGFKAALLAGLSRAELPALRPLTTRDDRDAAILLLDAWASVADVLTFHQERIANEAYLRTATERRSLTWLGRLTGYEPAPGLAASAHLAFTLEDAVGTPDQLRLDAGLKVQSMPGPGELPQTFETVEAIDARPEWNAMRPVLWQKHPEPSASLKTYTVKGADPSLRPGDTLLVVAGTAVADRVVRRVRAVRTDTMAGTTRLDVAEDPPDPPPFLRLVLTRAAFVLQPMRLSTASVTANVLSGAWRQADLSAFAKVQRWSVRPLIRSITLLAARRDVPAGKGLFRFRKRAAVFGHNAPAWDKISAPLRKGEAYTASTGATAYSAPPYPSSWDAATANRLSDDTSGSEVHLDGTHPEVVAGGWVVLESPTAQRAYGVDDNAEVTRTGFTLSAKVSRLRLNTRDGLDGFTRRETTVHAESQALELAPLPVTDVVEGASLVLDAPYLGLAAGRPVALSGRREDLEGVEEAEIVILSEVLFQEGRTELRFETALRNRYIRDSVRVNGNVARATHGETKLEVLGGGDATQPFQRFTLRQGPLTYIPARIAAGAQAALEVRIGGVLWREAESLFRRGAQDRVYTLRREEDGRTTIGFGDGITGARLPTGADNVTARLRQGIGAAGLVGEDRLTLLATRPLGVRGVTNPVAAEDAAEPEGADSIRASAPLRVLTLGRVVSVQDYEDFARAFTGISKALASWSWTGRERAIVLTVAGQEGRPVEPTGPVATNLLAALREAGDPLVPVMLHSFTPVFFRLTAKLKLDADLAPQPVLAAVEGALRQEFGFGRRAFGQGVTASEVMAAVHGVPGVLAMDLDALFRSDRPETLEMALTAALPRAGETAPAPAELLTLDPRPIGFGVLP
jgi:predicted phage baseplate assembly protein